MPFQQRDNDNAPAALRSSTPGRLGQESSSLVRRLAAVLIGVWFGAILVVALGAPAAFHSVDGVLASPPPSVAKAVEALGPGPTRNILRYQVSEANRMLFEIWGWVQVGLGLTVVVLLLFLSNAGRSSLWLSVAMLAMAVMMNSLLIPRMEDTGRQMAFSVHATPAELADRYQRFEWMHFGFSAFELIVVALGAILLVLLLRSRRGLRFRYRRTNDV